MFCEKDVLRNLAKFTGKHLCQSLFFSKVADIRPATLLKKKNLEQVFSCEFCKISKNTFTYRAPVVTASVISHSGVYPLSFIVTYGMSSAYCALVLGNRPFDFIILSNFVISLVFKKI